MTDFLNKSTVLVLNRNCYCFGTITPKKALVALNSQSGYDASVARAIDVVYKRNEDGSINLNELDYWHDLTFEEWMIVEPRGDFDNVIHTTKSIIRSPTVIMTNYSKMPMRRFNPTKSKLYELQGGKCGYSGKQISIKKGNIEHKKPKSFGGGNTFENLMFVDADINSKRGNKPLEELGLVPLFKHSTPKPIPAHFTIKQVLHPDWKWFIDSN